MIKQITKQDFDQIKTDGRPKVIDFYEPLCAQCRALHPILDRLATEYEEQIDFYKNDLAVEDDALYEDFKVAALPTLVFIDKDGNEVKRTTGMKPRNTIVDILQTIN